MKKIIFIRAYTKCMKLPSTGKEKKINFVELEVLTALTTNRSLQLFYPEDGGSTFFRNARNDLPGYMASHSRRHNSSTVITASIRNWN
jgi:hypothetical protein